MTPKQETVYNQIKFGCLLNGNCDIVLDYRQSSGIKLVTLEALKKQGLITYERKSSKFNHKVYTCKIN